MARQTPWQTVGPFFHYALPWEGGADLFTGRDIGARPDLIPQGHHGAPGPVAKPEGEAKGERISISGRVLDGDGKPVADALIEIWQANAAGRYASPADTRDDVALDPAFTGFGRSATGDDGSFLFHTIRPGRVPGPGNSLQAPHIAVSIFARGILKRLVTRIYFAGDPANEEDPIIALVNEKRHHTLFAKPDAHGIWRFDINLQGKNETVFFDI